MQGVNAYGRRWRSPAVAVTGTPDGIQLRITDGADRESWLVVTIDTPAVWALLNLTVAPDVPEVPDVGGLVPELKPPTDIPE